MIKLYEKAQYVNILTKQKVSEKTQQIASQKTKGSYLCTNLFLQL